MANQLNHNPIRAVDGNGNPVSGALARFYNVNTVTEQTVYSDSALSAVHAQPLVADSSGVFPQVFTAGAVQTKVNVTDSSGVTLPGFPLDPANSIPLSTSGASAISFSPPPWSSSTTVQDAIEEVHTKSLQNVVEDTTPQLGGILDTNSKQVRWSKGADVASASALTLGDDGNNFDVTGTATINTIATKGVGTVVALHFDGAAVLASNPPFIVVPTTANITAEAGDIAVLQEYSAGSWRVISYQRNNGRPLYQGVYVQAQCVLNGTGTPSVSGDFNIASVTDNGTGDYTLNFTTAMSSANYNVQITLGPRSDSRSVFGFVGTRATGSVQIIVLSNVSESSTPAAYDHDEIHVAVIA